MTHFAGTRLLYYTISFKSSHFSSFEYRGTLEFIDGYLVLSIALKHSGDTLELYHIWEGMEGMDYHEQWQKKPDDIPFKLKVENRLHAICN